MRSLRELRKSGLQTTIPGGFWGRRMTILKDFYTMRTREKLQPYNRGKKDVAHGWVSLETVQEMARYRARPYCVRRKPATALALALAMIEYEADYTRGVLESLSDDHNRCGKYPSIVRDGACSMAGMVVR
jgi:hypothetical protein